MNRRMFLQRGGIVAAGIALGAWPRLSRWASAAETPRWRTFEVTTKITIAEASGVSRAWVPIPLMTDTDYFKRLGDTWMGNTATAQIFREDKYDAGMVVAEWPASEHTPELAVTSRFATRDRQVDFRQSANGGTEDPTVLALYLQPTRLLPTDGLVAETASEITKGLTGDLEKARAIYEWIVEHTFRDPKVRGCGVGDISGMLETGYLGGKCADLNALYVGLARAAGLPARDVYGVRVATSAEFKSLGKSDDITKAQHCRAEVFLSGYGWVPVDPADVRKVVLEERPEGLTLEDPLVQKARRKLFGAWELNWVPFNYAHDVRLPNTTGPVLPFLMYPQAETAAARKDELAPETFRYTMTARELTS